MFQIKNSITKDDYLVFNQYHLLHSEQGKRAINMFRILTPVVSLLAIVIFWIAEVSQTLLIAEIIALSIVSIVMAFYSKKILLKSIKKNIRKLEKDGKLPFNKETTITFNDDSLHEKTIHTETSIQYAAIEKIIQGDQAIYVYFSALQAFIFPYRSFESDEQKNEFITFLNAKCGKALL
ncbi:MAG: YcxB family protein [Firmicutes bacterium]|nr:YcxB family protein [Bacillota bacterium]